MKNIILIGSNVDNNWEIKRYLDEFTGENWEIIKCVSNRNFGSALQSVKRYMKFLFFPLTVFYHRKEYDKIIAWQQMYGLFLAFFLRLFHCKKRNKITIITFIYKKKKGVAGAIYDKIMRYIVTSKYIDKFVVFSKYEAEFYPKYFNVSPDKFKSLKLAIPDVRNDYNIEYSEPKYYISVGRSNRDYDFLYNIWNKYDYELKVICDVSKENNTDKITHYKDCHKKEYHSLLAKCFAVIIPIKDANISSGQLVALESMMLGKPLIVTESNTIGEYINDCIGATMIKKEEQALLSAMQVLENQEEYYKMSKASREYFESNYSYRALAKGVADLIKRI